MMAAAPAKSRIRPFAADDIPQVADLHRRVFGVADQSSPELLNDYRTYFTDVYLSNPLDDEASGSLVHQEKDGRITGFLAVTPRLMTMKGQTVRARLTSQFVVDPEFRGYVGLKLLSTVLNGPQDLTIADESNADSRMLWEAIGGVTSHLYSMRWFYALRPCQFGLYVAGRKRLLPPLLSSIAAPLPDTSTPWLPGSRNSPSASRRKSIRGGSGLRNTAGLPRRCGEETVDPAGLQSSIAELGFAAGRTDAAIRKSAEGAGQDGKAGDCRLVSLSSES